MLNFIYGNAGSGKTTETVRRVCEDLKNGKDVFVLVPEQQALLTERLIADYSSGENIPVHRLEVLNFKRLCNRIFREYGGLSYNYIGKGACALIMWQALFSIAPALREYGGMLSSCEKFIPMMLDTVSLMKENQLTPSVLLEASSDLKEAEPRLFTKISDIALIYSAYEQLLHERFDDPSDDLTKIAEILDSNDFFAEKSVYIDSFDGFTKQEYAVLERMIRGAADFTMTFAFDPSDDRQFFDGLRDTEKRIRQICGKENKEISEQLVLSGHPRFGSEALSFAEKNLFDDNRTETCTADSVRIISCRNPYEEAEAIANDILRRIREGCRYRDIAVIFRDASVWDGIITYAFDNAGIPYHFSRRERLETYSVFRLLIAALRIRTDNWRKEDVISYIKTGYTDLLPEEADEIEKYAEKWSINGSRWHDEYGWYMNPAGYSETISEENVLLLERLNASKNKLVKPLTALYDVFSGDSATVKEIASAVYRYLCEAGIREKIAEKDPEKGILYWNILMDALDETVMTIGDLKVTSLQFSELFSLVIRQTDTGILPAYIDEVTIGSADRLRTGNVRHCYIGGLNEGNFPKKQEESAVFSDNDLLALDTCGISLGDDAEKKIREEYHLFYRSVFCASDSVTLLYSRFGTDAKELKMSSLCTETSVLFENEVNFRYSDLCPDLAIQNINGALKFAVKKENGAGAKILGKILSEDKRTREILRASEQSLGAEDEKFDEETAGRLFGGNMALTQSRLDSYVLCGFGYGCKYLLKLDEGKKADFDNADIGIFVHSILEKFMNRIRTENGINTDLTEDEIDRLAAELTSECADRIFGRETREMVRSNRVIALLERLKRTVVLLFTDLLGEFRQSEFMPECFELPIKGNGTENDEIEPLRIPLGDGTSAYIYGIADRVDVYRRDKDVYFRVIDYKTGTKDFSLTDIYQGLNLQMLLYLFSIWNDGQGSFRRILGADKDTKVMPAGVLYYAAKLPSFTTDHSKSRSELLEEASAKLKRSGMLLDDKEILEAMEKKLKGRYIPVQLNKDGGFKTNMTLESLSEFGHLMEKISDRIRDICGELRGGKASARPLVTKRHDACRGCPMRPVCRIRNTRKTDESEEN